MFSVAINVQGARTAPCSRLVEAKSLGVPRLPTSNRLVQRFVLQPLISKEAPADVHIR